MNGCFVYLINHTERAVADGVKSLTLLHAHYLSQFPTPVVLFHERELTDEMKVRLASAVDDTATFVLVDFSTYPPGSGYNHMCRFFAGEIFKHPVLAPFDYVCRLDTDSFILAPIAYDLFVYAQSNEVYYGYLNDEIHDKPEFCVGLWEAARDAIDAAPNLNGGRLYYTNFEVCHLPWFRSAVWQMYCAQLDAAGGIYTHRWGDHTIRYLGVKTLLPPNQVKQFPDIMYSHQGIGAGHAA